MTFKTDSSTHSYCYTWIKAGQNGKSSTSWRPQGLQELCNCVGGDFRGNSCYILICTNQETQRMFPTKGKHLMSLSKSCLSGRKDWSHPALGLMPSTPRENWQTLHELGATLALKLDFFGAGFDGRTVTLTCPSESLITGFLLTPVCHFLTGTDKTWRWKPTNQQP